MAKQTNFARIYWIDAEIASKTYPNTRFLAEKYAVSEATISRDIAFMRDRLNAPIEYAYSRRGYQYSDHGFRILSSFMSPEDVRLFNMVVLPLLSFYKGTSFYQKIEKIVHIIIAPFLLDKDSPKLSENVARIIIPQTASTPVDSDLWSTIIRALHENRVITFDYKGLQDSESHHWRVQPWHLFFDNGVWSLSGYSEERLAECTFLLQRMRNPFLTNDTFSMPYGQDGVDVESYFGVIRGKKVYHFRIFCMEEAAVQVREQKWAADQVIEETDQGVVFSFSSSQDKKVEDWVLSKGCYACPLEPQWLVNFWNGHIEEMERMKNKRENLGIIKRENLEIIKREKILEFKK
ncbi:hypothetical protein FACS1894172_04040 [Spirochaetia bacterium]|nr:hypothetical protein FACS1894164_07300 [Spirochaetia bacterium]GHU30562.1 hypothetical protein FACS1894172_04040 [Spirochaetia bacterium]